MALEDILVAIRAETDDEIARIRAESDAAVATIAARAREEAADVERTAAASMGDQAAHERERITNRARLEADRDLRAATEEIYLGLRSEVASRLAFARESPGYPALVSRLLDECRSILPGARTVRVDPDDEKLTRGILKAAGCDGFVVDPGLASLGGVELVTGDGRRVDNTLDSRMERGERHLRSLALEMMPELRGGTE